MSTAETAHALLAYQANLKELKFELIIEEHIQQNPLYYGDSNRLKQILLNWLGNAIKFTKIGEVVLTIERTENQLSTTSSESTTNSDEVDYIRLEVRDSGIGIEDTSKLFKPFVQANSQIARKYGGTGLGLNITRQLVELMGGKVGISSVLGQGTKVWAVIPLKRMNKENQNAVVGDLLVNAENNIRILVAEDNSVNQKVLYFMLTKIGYENITLVSDGHEALQVLVSIIILIGFVLINMTFCCCYFCCCYCCCCPCLSIIITFVIRHTKMPCPRIRTTLY